MPTANTECTTLDGCPCAECVAEREAEALSLALHHGIAAVA